MMIYDDDDDDGGGGGGGTALTDIQMTVEIPGFAPLAFDAVGSTKKGAKNLACERALSDYRIGLSLVIMCPSQHTCLAME
jgi:hypothetical protein